MSTRTKFSKKQVEPEPESESDSSQESQESEVSHDSGDEVVEKVKNLKPPSATAQPTQYRKKVVKTYYY